MDWAVLLRVIALAKPYKKVFVSAAILTIFQAALSAIRPKLVQLMVDRHLLTGVLEGLGFLLFLSVFFIVIQAIFRYYFIYSTWWLGQSVVRDLRKRVFDHLIHLRLTYFDQTPIGTSTTRTINDIETLNRVYANGLITIIADILSVLAVLAMMFYTSWKLTLICLVTMPFLILSTYIFKEKVKKAFQRVRAQISIMNAYLQERITGMRIIQVFNAEADEMKKFRAINRKYTAANLDSVTYYAVFFPVVEIISAVSLGLMIWWGAQDALRQGGVTLGAIVAFPIYLNMLFRPIRMLADKFNTIQMGLVAAERVFSLLDFDSKISNKGSLKPEKLEGKVSFQQVSFAYDTKSDQKTYVLKDLSFDVEAGESLAIVGRTGSGKTTIINILNRFYPLTEGKILIDGTDFKSFDLYALRKRIAVVLQDVFLFSGSVMENITMYDNQISRSKVIDAAKMIGAHDFIMKLPGGYDYQVMERGATLSMGQRQLISFVRALVFDPEILILDEATSSIDPETEAIIQYAIEKLIYKRTSFIIAHRLSTIQHVDKVMVLEKGELIEIGSPAELLKNPEGHYKRLYEMQFLNKEEDIII